MIGVGQLNWMKGYDYALEAVASLVRDGVPVTYEILGGEPPATSGKPSDRGRLLYLIHELGLEGRVRLLGKVSQEVVRERLWAFGRAAAGEPLRGPAEHGARGDGLRAPVVVTDCGGVREAVEHGVEGFVCPRRSPQALADALGSLRDRALARALGRRAGRGSVPTSRSASASRASGASTRRSQTPPEQTVAPSPSRPPELTPPRADQPPEAGRSLRSKAGGRIVAIDAHPWPRERRVAMDADGKCGTGAVAGSLAAPTTRASTMPYG